MRKVARFLYLNFYAFLFLLLGTGFLLCHFVLEGTVWLIIQLILAFVCFFIGFNLLGMWEEKQRMYKILFQRNKNGFRPETFKVYMDAPCGRMVSRIVLKDLGMKNEYRQLLIYKPSLKDSLQELLSNGRKRNRNNI